MLDANAASRQELVALVGIGEGLAEAIVLGRPFQRIDDLLAIPGIGPITLDSLIEQDLVVVVNSETRASSVPGAEEFVPDEGMKEAVVVSTMPGEELARPWALGVMPGEELAESTVGVIAMPGENHAESVTGTGAMPGEGPAETASDAGAMPGEAQTETTSLGLMPGEGPREPAIDVGAMPGEGSAVPVPLDSMPEETMAETVVIGTMPGDEKLAGLEADPFATVLADIVGGEERSLTLQGGWRFTLKFDAIRT
jgi:hypothetical protein